MRIFQAVVLAAFIVAGATPGAAAEDCAPFRLAGPSDGLIVVETMLDGKGPFQMVVDTGATITMLSATAAKGLDLVKVRGIATASGAGGAFRATPAVVRRMQVGGALQSDVSVALTDISRLGTFMGTQIDGFVGYSFLKAYRVTVDYPQRRICFAS